jgi:electron transfer flavoprotein alpha subunit
MAGDRDEVVDMTGVLIVAEQLRGTLSPVVAELVTAGRQLDGAVAVAVIGPDPETLASGARLDGVSEVLLVESATEEFDSDFYRRALETLISERQPDVVLLGFSVNAMSYGPATAAKLGLGFASDVFALERDGSGVVARRSFYGGKVDAELGFEGAPVVLSLRPTVWEKALPAGQPDMVRVEVPAAATRTRHLRFVERPSSGLDITKAPFLLSVGRGIGERENVALFEHLAEKMSATLSCSRPLVDAGWLDPARQVGQSGNTVSPRLYLAFGISGAIQHLAGMKTSATIIAVNTDPEAAIFGVAHYGVVKDLFAVAEELEKLY